jgi:curved DNA-binding protein CbpA
MSTTVRYNDVVASLYHPDRDQSEASTRRMAELNDAYASLRTDDRRALYDAQRQHQAQASAVVTPYRTAAPAPGIGSSTDDALNFGRYEGWTIAKLAMRDPTISAGCSATRRVSAMRKDRGRTQRGRLSDRSETHPRSALGHGRAGRHSVATEGGVESAQREQRDDRAEGRDGATPVMPDVVNAEGLCP